jgi:hypothetical protein
MAALGQLAAAEHVGGMMQGVLKAKKGSERDAAEKAVMLACSRIAELGRRADPLLSAWEQFSELERKSLLPTIGRVGGPIALRTIEAAIADSDPETHEMGLLALCNWPEASVAQRLEELSRQDEHPQHRSMALDALIRVAPLPDKRPAAEKLDWLKRAMPLSTRDQQKNLVLKRARAVRTVDTLRFVAPYMDQAAYAQAACETVVELAHHRDLREPNKVEFDKALDKVIAISKDLVLVERAGRYKKGQTWAKPTVADVP